MSSIRAPWSAPLKRSLQSGESCSAGTSRRRVRILRKLLRKNRLQFKPYRNGRDCGYEFTVQLSNRCPVVWDGVCNHGGVPNGIRTLSAHGFSPAIPGGISEAYRACGSTNRKTIIES